MGQTSKAGNIYFPRGTKVSVKAFGDSVFTDVGVIMSTVANSFTWTENEILAANYDGLDIQYKNMIIEGSFTLGNLEPASLVRMSGGLLTETITAGTPFIDAPDQTILSGSWSDVSPIELVPTTAALASVRATALALTSVTGGTDGVLTADDDYTLIVDSNSACGFAIVPNLAGTNLTTEAQDLVISFASITPVASTQLTGGHSTFVATAYAVRMTTTDDNGKVRQFDLYSVYMNSGGFVFNYKGSNEDGIEEMPISFKAKLDSSLTSGAQLFSLTTDDGYQ